MCMFLHLFVTGVFANLNVLIISISFIFHIIIYLSFPLRLTNMYIDISIFIFFIFVLSFQICCFFLILCVLHLCLFVNFSDVAK